MDRAVSAAWASCAACVLVASTATPARGDDAADAAATCARSESIESRCDRIVKRFGKQGFTGAVVVARKDQVIAASGVGSADLAGATPITTETLFEIASLTKQFTAAAVMKLVQNGKLRLDDPISKHLPGIPENCKAITIEHLLRHTSGIPRSNAEGEGDDLAAVIPSFLAGGPRHEPGTNFEYWNQGYALLSEIVKRVSGRDYVTFCKEELFAPAGMTTARFTGDSAKPGEAVATGRSGMGAPRSALEHPYGAYGFQYRGMGGAVCSAEDLRRWDRALTGDSVLNAESRATLFKPGLGDYALGWYVARDDKGRLRQVHGGGVRGFACDMRRYPEIDGVIIVLSNDDRQEAWQFGDALQRALLGDPPSPEESMSLIDAATADWIIGAFQSDRGYRLEIERQGEVASARVQWSAPDGPITRATLLIDDAGEIKLVRGSYITTLPIERDDKGRAVSITFQNNRYRRIAPAPK